jgi:iron complex transport system ATP-binding protein
MVIEPQSAQNAPGATPGPALRATGLRFGYPGGPEVVSGVDLELFPGELYALLGQNGAGKSTLLRLLSGALQPSAGRVELGAGQVLRDLRPRQRARRVAVVPQGLAAVPDWTVRDFVASGRYAHLPPLRSPTPADRAAVDRALEQCDLAGLGPRPLPELSAGQRQRALLARALVQDAPVWLIDEPTSSLDLPHQLATFELIAALTCQGRAVLTVTHDLNLASQFATRLGLLHGGRLRAEGDVPTVLNATVLNAVYGAALHYGHFPAGPGGQGAPFVLPWRR